MNIICDVDITVSSRKLKIYFFAQEKLQNIAVINELQNILCDYAFFKSVIIRVRYTHQITISACTFLNNAAWSSCEKSVSSW